MAHYSALSHCWGSSNRPLKTTLENLELHLTGFDESSLPKTFMDAIAVNRKLGIPYLWIDSLCIIQDDPDDWQRESAQMASIYRNAYLTLAAADARDSSEGCFPQPLNPSLHCQVMDPTKSGVLCNAFARAPYGRGSLNDDFLESSVLSQRGWILQEMILSRRILYLTNDQLYWQCNSRYCSEDGTVDLTRDAALQQEVEQRGSELSRNVGLLKLYRLENKHQAFETWWLWVMDFNERQLTNPSDKLPALAGLVKYYQKRTGDTPLVGLWRKDIFNHLLWTVQDRTIYQGGASYCIARRDIPSWSWASINGHVAPFFNEGLHYAARRTRKLQLCKRKRPLWKRDVLPELLSTSIVWSGEPLTSSIVEARLQIRGRVLPRIYQDGNLIQPEGRRGVALDEFAKQMRKARLAWPGTEWFHRTFNPAFKPHFDVEHTPPDGTEYLCLYMKSMDETLDLCLLLQAAEDVGEGCYRRVGVADHYQVESTFYGFIEERTIFLV